MSSGFDEFRVCRFLGCYRKRGWGQLKANERSTIFGTDVSFRGSVPTLRTIVPKKPKATRVYR